MNTALLAVLVVLAVGMIVPGLADAQYRLQFPCLAGFTVLIQVALPLAALNADFGAIAPGHVTRFTVMSILCVSAAWAGYGLGPRGGGWRRVWEFNARRLKVAAFALVSFGLVFGWKYGRIEPEIDVEKGGMTGIGTIYLTLAQVSRFGFVLAGIVLARTRDWRMAWVMLPQGWVYYRLVTMGRRSPAGELAVMLCMLLYFYRGWRPGLWLVAAGIAAAGVWSLNIGQVRSSVDRPLPERMETWLAERPWAALTRRGMIEQHQYVEVYNGAQLMEARARGGHYGGGLHFWNQLVFGFVPGQFVGQGLKESLQFGLRDDARTAGFEKAVGTCETGLAEAFMAFGYFGCGLFYLLGMGMRRIWDGAASGGVGEQLLLGLLTLGAVMTFSAQLWTLVNTFVTVVIFAGPCLWWSRERTEVRKSPRTGTQSEKNPSESPLASGDGSPRRRWV